MGGSLQRERIGASTGALQQELVTLEEQVSEIRARQLELLELDRRQVHTGDECRTLGTRSGTSI